MAWYLNPALTRFRAAVDARWPNRDRASDGTIGDAAHQARTSDHNPDLDGSVDAWDMDAGPGVDVDACIAAAIRHESIAYVIYNRRITSRNQAGGLGTWHPYTGDNPHTQHVHFNTRESHERSTKPWFTATLEDDMPLSTADVNAIATRILGDGGMQMLFTRVEALTSGRDPHTGGQANVLHQRLVALANALGQVDEVVAAQLRDEFAKIEAAVGQVDEAVLAGLGAVASPQEQADLLRAALGSDRAREVGALLASA